MPTNLLLNGDIAPTFPNVVPNRGAQVQPGKIVFTGPNQVVYLDIAPLEKDKRYSAAATIGAYAGGKLRVRIAPVQSGTHSVLNATIASEGPSDPLYLTAQGWECVMILDSLAGDDPAQPVGFEVTLPGVFD